tara:strand:+ start:14477 stop:15058 length:582 start_codon:yes stop_codon:yes gene_type:complete
MAISVTKFMVSNDLSTIDLKVGFDNAVTGTSLLFWNQDTYRDPAQSVDLTSLLTGSQGESISITLNNTGESTFSGMYFLQILDSNGDAVVVATFNLTQYYIIQAKLIANVDLSCLNCNANFQNALLFDMYLEATKQALLLGRFQDAIDNLKKLIITVDTSDCDSCNDIDPVVSTAGNIVSVGVLDCELTEDGA